MKVRTSIKKRCEYCYIVRRRKSGKSVVYIYCKRNSRHKQRQG